MVGFGGGSMGCVHHDPWLLLTVFSQTFCDKVGHFYHCDQYCGAHSKPGPVPKLQEEQAPAPGDNIPEHGFGLQEGNRCPDSGEAAGLHSLPQLLPAAFLGRLGLCLHLKGLMAAIVQVVPLALLYMQPVQRCLLSLACVHKVPTRPR